MAPNLVFATKPAPWVGSSLDNIPCAGGKPGIGPFDYTQRSSIDPQSLRVVEDNHFTPEVENLIRGNTAARPEHDLNFTLRDWPNHHRALLSIIKYQLNINSKLMQDKLSLPPECYLQRAIHFSPQDAFTYSLYGYYLRKLGRLENAVKYYKKAIDLAPENSKINYSFSLLLIDLKRYDDALKLAKIAYRDKHTPKGLKKKLTKLGVWTE